MLVEVLDISLIPLQFQRSAAGEGQDVKGQNDVFLAQVVAQSDHFAVLVLQFEVGRLVAHLQGVRLGEPQGQKGQNDQKSSYNMHPVILDEQDAVIQIDFYTRPRCCLCDEAMLTLRRLGLEFPLRVRTIDVSQSPDLLARFGNHVPVAMVGDRELFRHRADAELLRGVFRSL